MTRIYAILCIAAACSIAAIYYYYNKTAYSNNEYQLLQTYSEQLSSEFDILVEDMNFAITYVLGEVEVLDSLKQVINNRDNPHYPNYFKQEAMVNIRSTLMKNFLNKNFYQARIFNEYGILLSQDTVSVYSQNTADYIKRLPWLTYVKERNGANTLIGSHSDEMNLDKDTEIISMVKEIRGYEGSFIEVQYEISELVKKLNIRDDIKGIAIARSDGEILYCSGDLLNIEQVRKLAAGIESADGHNRKNMIVSYASPKNDIRMVVAGDMETVDLLPIKKAAALLGILIFAVLLLYVNVSAGIIVRPLKKLRGIMEITELENIDKKIELNSHIEEFDALADSYEDLLGRLQNSVIRNKKIEQLHMQAQFDSLQSKISPHFMSNVLNVISSRGLEMGDLEISQICASMVALLRYSSDTRSKTATVEEELYYLEKYCYIMKLRYMQKFSHHIDIPAAIKKQKLPPLSLQLMAENSIKHGFERKLKHIAIQVSGRLTGDKWYICFQDNGQGFDPDTLAEIYTKADDMKKQLLKKDRNIELVLGGMGLINLYLRMYFLYGDDMVFSIDNNENGAAVTIGGTLAPENGESGK